MIRSHSVLRRLPAAALAGAVVLAVALTAAPAAAASGSMAETLAALKAQFSAPERPRAAPAEPGLGGDRRGTARPGPGETRSGDAKSAEAQSARPEPRVDRSRDLDFLFEALKSAPDADSARLVENRIMSVWLASGSDTADLLMSRARQAGEAKQHELGLKLLDTVVDLRPDFAEGWNRRATLHFLNKDFGAALDDLRQVLAREPRHFGALVGLGMILQEIEEEKMALTVLRRAIELHPHLPRVPELIRSLTEKVEGRPT